MLKSIASHVLSFHAPRFVLTRPRTVDKNEIISRAGKSDPQNIDHVARDDQNFGFRIILAGQQESESILLSRLKGKNKKIKYLELRSYPKSQ
jgi:hypothetical protein